MEFRVFDWFERPRQATVPKAREKGRLRKKEREVMWTLQ